jgi:hypothetical protein
VQFITTAVAKRRQTNKFARQPEVNDTSFSLTRRHAGRLTASRNANLTPKGLHSQGQGRARRTTTGRVQRKESPRANCTDRATAAYHRPSQRGFALTITEVILTIRIERKGCPRDRPPRLHTDGCQPYAQAALYPQEGSRCRFLLGAKS